MKSLSKVLQYIYTNSHTQCLILQALETIDAAVQASNLQPERQCS